MKSWKTNRMQLILVGAGAILLGSPARAQQETDPTIFEATSMVPQSEISTAQTVLNSEKESKGEKQAIASLNQASKDATLEGNVARMMTEEVAILVIMLAGIASIALYAMAATGRERQLQASPETSSYSTTTSAKAHGLA